MVRRQRGFSVLEVIVGLAVVTVLATSVPVGGQLELRAVQQSLRELEASRAAAGRIEALRAGAAPLRTGVFPDGTQEVVAVEPGLYEVRVRVADVELVTLLAREEGP